MGEARRGDEDSGLHGKAPQQRHGHFETAFKVMWHNAPIHST